MEYESCGLYIDSAESKLAKIQRIDAIIVVLEDAALKSAANMDLTEYSLDNGQTKVKTIYRDVDAIVKAIMNFRKLKQLYVNSLNGRTIRLQDAGSTNIF